MFATSGGKLYGGNSGSSLIGTYTEKDGLYSSELMMSRHNHDPNYVATYPIDNIAMTFNGGFVATNCTPKAARRHSRAPC